MKASFIPVFRGRRALILHKDDRDRQLLESQLTRLGMVVKCTAVGDGLDWSLVDVCFFDADAQRQHAFPWAVGAPSIPLIAMIGSETPERIQWSLSQGISTFLVKPVRSNGTFLALMQAEHVCKQRKTLDAEVNELKDRVKSRRIVFKALLLIMKRHSLSEDEAFDRIREVSMQRGISIEELCVALICGEQLGEWKQPKVGTG
jgi:AmiR/NasT family two-component response regulator